MATTAPPVPRRRPALRWALGLIALLVLLIGAAVGGAAWLLRSESGTAWLVSKVPGVEVQGLSGALFGERLGAERLRWQGEAGTLEIEGLELSGMRWSWRPSPRAWLGLHDAQLAATRLQWQSGSAAPAAGPPSAPTSLQLPIEAQVRVRVQTLQIDALAPVQDLAFAVHAGAQAGAQHRIDELSLRWDRLSATGRLRIDAAAPFALEGGVQLEALAGAPMPWQAELRAGGALERITLDADLRSDSRPDVKGASLTLQSSLTPFARWPLAELTAATEALDLSALSSQLPQTRLKARAELHSQALDQPMQAELSAENTAPGRWDEGRLPLRTLALAIEATPTQLDRVAISQFDFGFGDASAAAGRWSGQGVWQGHTLTLQTRVADLLPQRLDGRAAPMTVGGPVTLTIDHLPSPDPAASAPSAAPEIALVAQLEGRVEAAPEPVKLDLKASARSGSLRIEQLLARVGEARAELQATARQSNAGWALETEGRLVDFDPRPWWQGPADSAWRRGPHKLNGDWSLALTLPQAAAAMAPMDMLRRLGGQGRVAIERSVLAGVPLASTIDLARDDGARVQARLQAGGNTVTISLVVYKHKEIPVSCKF